MPDDHPPPAPISYAEAIRRHPRVLLGIAAAALLVGMLWVLVRSPAYEASAKVLVAPVAAEERAFVGLPVLRETGDATRTVQTAAGLLESPAAAVTAATTLGPDWTGPQVDASVSIEAQGESSLVAVTGRGGSPGEAARVATPMPAPASACGTGSSAPRSSGGSPSSTCGSPPCPLAAQRRPRPPTAARR